MSENSGESVVVKGYKATDADMRCLGYQYELGVWHKHEGEIVMCESGFHFCEYASGPWFHYGEQDTRIFEVEARGVIKGEGPGASLKYVANEIMLVREITPGGNNNTGDKNTGDNNTGDLNAGNQNTGDLNTGNYNTGDWNTGIANTGNRNTGDGNAGHRNSGDGNAGHDNSGNMNTGSANTGYGNTGDWNTGNGNTGHVNTGNLNTGNENTGRLNTGNLNKGDWNVGHHNNGDWNTGDWNTGQKNSGYGNATDQCSGYFCVKKQPFIIFDEPANRDDVNFELVARLFERLFADVEFDPEPFLSLPNATVDKIKALHLAHIEGRKRFRMANQLQAADTVG